MAYAIWVWIQDSVRGFNMTLSLRFNGMLISVARNAMLHRLTRKV